MGLFDKMKTTENSADRASAQISESHGRANVTPIHDQANQEEIKRARDMFEALNAELRESSAKQESARSRMASLNEIISKMELDIKSLNRVESDNRLLRNSERDFNTKLAQKTAWARELDSKLNDLERRYNETCETLKVAQADIAASRDTIVEKESQIADNEKTIRILTARNEAYEDKSSHTNQTLEKLRNTIDELNANLSQKNREVIELSNSMDELNAKYESKSKAYDTLSVESKNMRLDFDELKNKYIETTGRVESYQYDMRTQKGVFEDTIRRRDEENLALKTRIDQLETQVRIKENMSSHLDQEFVSLRNELMTERERTSRLEQRLMQKTEEAERTNSALNKSKSEYQELNSKFATTLEDFDTLRRVNQTQREKLERYASIGGTSGHDIVLPSDTMSEAKTTNKVTVLDTTKKKK